MAFLEINHTQAVLNKLRKDVFGFMKFVRTTTMIGFSAWYVYLIVTNFASIAHLIAYALLFVMVILTYVVEKTIKPTDDDTRKDKRKKVEKRRRIAKATKIVKYLAKAVTIGFALYNSLTAPTSKWDLILDVVSGGMWLISILSEFVTGFINRYIDYFTISVAMDIQNSDAVDVYKKVAKLFGDKQLELDDINNELMLDSGESLYTTQEEKIRAMLAEEANALREQKAERKKQRQAKIEEQLVEAKAKKKQAHADKVAATQAEKKRIAEEKRQAKRDAKAEKKRQKEEKRQAKKSIKPQ